MLQFTQAPKYGQSKTMESIGNIFAVICLISGISILFIFALFLFEFIWMAF